MTLVEHLTKIKEHLSNKERWEEYWENNKVTGYSSGSLANTLGGIWGDKQKYAAAYDCVSRAINDLVPDLILNRKSIAIMDGDPVSLQQYRIVDSFGDIKDHDQLMRVLDLAIRYAKLCAFS
jgi:hypothetical protein